MRGTLASSKANSGARTITIKTVRFPAADVAIADGEYVIAATSSAQARNMWTSFVLIRAGGRWRIDAIRNMLPGPAQKASEPARGRATLNGAASPSLVTPKSLGTSYGTRSRRKARLNNSRARRAEKAGPPRVKTFRGSRGTKSP